MFSSPKANSSKIKTTMEKKFNFGGKRAYGNKTLSTVFLVLAKTHKISFHLSRNSTESSFPSLVSCEEISVCEKSLLTDVTGFS